MLSRQRLFWRLRPYDLPCSDRAFLRACRDNCAYHIRHCPGYAAICGHLGFSPDQLRTMEDLAKIPVIPTLFFKRKALFSMSQRRMAMKVTSSGTSGRFSRIGFDWGSILAEVPMVINLGFRHHLVSPKPAHCVILGYKPHKSNHTGVTRTMFGLTHFSPPLSRTYALRMADGAYVPDLDSVAKALKRLEGSPFPTRVIGFPSYLWFGLKRMEELGLRVRLPRGSRIILAGGWKQHADQEVDKGTLYALVERVLGIPEEKSVLLQHMLLSHHGDPAFGAAVRPMCAESELLSLIDLVDSRMEIYREALAETEPGQFSRRVFALDKKVFRHQ